jgi:NTE family protein
VTLQSWLEENPFTLSLSSGFFGFYAHTGFVRALEERGLSARAYASASAGAIVAAAAAKGLTAKEIQELVLGVKREDFWDPAPGLGLVRGKKFERLLRTSIGTEFGALKKPLRVATFDILRRKTEVFTDGDLAKAIRASCAVPVMFHPVQMRRSPYWDGGILDKMALSGIDSRERVLGHYLQGSNRYELYERRRDEKTWSGNRQVIVLEGLARSGPYKMHLGPEIVAAAYRQTLARLDKPI